MNIVSRKTVGISVAVALAFGLSGCGSSGDAGSVKIDDSSYFIYTSPKSVHGILYLHGTTPEAGEKIFIENLRVDAGNCEVQSFSPVEKTEVTNKTELSFDVNFTKECYTNEIKVSGVKEKFWEVDQESSTSKFETSVRNKNPYIYNKQHYVLTIDYDAKPIADYKPVPVTVEIKDNTGKPVENENIVSIKAWINGDSAVILDGDEKVKSYSFNDPNPFSVLKVARSDENGGLSTLTVEVKIKDPNNDNYVYTYQKSIVIDIENVDISSLGISAFISIAKSVVESYKPIPVIFEILQKNKPVAKDFIESLSVYVNNPKLIQISTDKNATNVTPIINFGNSVDGYGKFYLVRSSNDSGTAKVYLEAKIKDPDNPTVVHTISKSASVTVKPLADESSKYKIDISAPEGNYIYKSDYIKTVFYQIMRDGSVVDASLIKDVKISVSDARKILLLPLAEEATPAATLDYGNLAFGNIRIIPSNDSGVAMVNIVAKVQGMNNPDDIYEVRRSFEFYVKDIPETFYDVFVVAPDIEAGGHGNIHYKIYYPGSTKIVDSEKIDKVILKTKTDNIVFVTPDGEKNEITIEKASEAVITVKAKKGGGDKAFVNIEADIRKGDSNETNASNVIKVFKQFSLNITGATEPNQESNITTIGDIRKIVIDEVRDYYDNQLGKFVKEINIKAEGAKPKTYVRVGAILPRIGNILLDNEPQNFYKTENSNVLYDGRFGINGGWLHGNEFNITNSKYKVAMNQIDIKNDELVILPNGIRSNIGYLGVWEFDLKNNHNTSYGVILKDKFDGNLTGLSWAIGTNGRYNPENYTISVLDFDKEKMMLDPDTNMARFKLYYPTFLIGKDVFVYADFREVDENGTVNRKGNTYKTTLKGAGISGTDIAECRKVQCEQDIYLTSSDTNLPVSYAHILPICQAEGADKIEFDKDNSNLVRTNGKGKLHVKITSTPIYVQHTDDQNNTYYTTEYNAKVSCDYKIDSEFSF